jgi:hypothetical protein
MINKIKSFQELQAFFTEDYLENGVGVIIDPAIPKECLLGIDIDAYYHSHCLAATPCIADLLILIQMKELFPIFSIYIIEMKNISKSAYFEVRNIYDKFSTVIEDFMKVKYTDPFLNPAYQVKYFKLFFVSDAYHLSQKGFTRDQIRSFLTGTKIETLQSLPMFTYRGFRVKIEYELPNPVLSWI